MQYIRQHFLFPPIFCKKKEAAASRQSAGAGSFFGRPRGEQEGKKMSDHSLIRTCQAVVYAAPVSDKCCNYWPARRRERDTSLPATEFPFQFFPIYPPPTPQPTPPTPPSCTATHHVISTKISGEEEIVCHQPNILMTVTLDGINLIKFKSAPLMD
jgi:hypothetical protein